MNPVRVLATGLVSLLAAGPLPLVPQQPFATPAFAQVPSSGPGVTTHFSQGWPPRLVESAATLGTTSVRDSIHWAAVETVRGTYQFTDRNSGHVARLCAAGMTVLLGIDPRNSIYDAGLTANSPAAQAAYANFIAAVARRFPSCVIAIEVGNEINGANNMTGPAARRRAQSHTALLRAVHARIKPDHPGLQIVGGSTNTIATGFLEGLFAAGALPYLDAVAVHPYRRDPETVDWELGRLRAAMIRHGADKPIWATEFSADVADAGQAPDYLLKMSALMHASGVAHQYWYALIDQQWFPNMGLLTASGAEKPVARAFSFIARTIGSGVTAERVDHGDPGLVHLRYDNGVHVVWGMQRAIFVQGPARVYRADGRQIAVPALVDDSPVIISGATNITFGPQQVLADSLLGFARPPLTWHARRVATGATSALVPVDWKWTSYLGSRNSPGMMVNADGIGPATGTSAVVRYTADRAAAIHASFCLSPLGTSGDGVRASLIHNGVATWSGTVSALTGPAAIQRRMAVAAGDSVELVISPGANPVGDRMRYRMRISLTSAAPATC